MPPRPPRLLRHLPFFIALLAAGYVPASDPFPAETSYRTKFDKTTVSLKGRVVDSSGAPVAGCMVRVSASASTNTAANGTFAFPKLYRSNQLVTVSAPGFYTNLVPVQLFVPLAQTNVLLPPVVLSPQTPSVVRFLFGGDTTFARRMLDPLDQTARDQMPAPNPDALINVTNPLPGTQKVLGFAKPVFLLADYPVVNFESVVTLDLSTPHLQKDYVYFTFPGSLPALKALNIDYVGLGNNHTYDYLESGVSNTLYYLDQAGLHHSGLGSNSAAAFVPYQTSIKGTPYSFLAMTSIGGEQHATNFVASGSKGGAAYIESKPEARAAIAAEHNAGRVTVVQPHVGDEYTLDPSPFALKWMQFAVDSGADLVVSHHTHVPQGFGMYKGVLLVHSLGNFCFDQDRLETMVGLLATIDMDGYRLRRAWGTPVYLEDYCPRFMAGRLPQTILRRISEVSQPDLRVFPWNGQAWLATRPGQYSFTDRRIEVPVTIPTNGWTIVDLREFASPDESLSRLETESPGLYARLGRDIMFFGDFEDVDIDAERGEASRWDFSTNSVVARQTPYRGTAALCMWRKSSLTTDAVAAFRNRIRVIGDSRNTPNKELSLLGYVRGQTAGRISVVSRYYASEGDVEFGEELALDHPGGTFAWRPFMQDLHMPPDDPTRVGDPATVNARAVRVFLHHSPPRAATSTAYAWFDELAVISWDEWLDPLAAPVLATPHPRDFLRLQGPPGSYSLALTFRKYRPAEADSAHGPHLALETEQPDQSPDRLWFRPTALGFDGTLRLLLWNQGNQPLVLSNLTFTTGQQTDFTARWLATNGSPLPAPGTVLSVPPRAAGRLEVRFAPTAAGTRSAVLTFKSNDPDDGQSLVTLTVGGDAFANVPVRYITGNRTLSPTVHIQVPITATGTNVLVEQLPAGVTPVADPSTLNSQLSTPLWDPASRTIQWRDLSARTVVSYCLVPNPSALNPQLSTPLSGYLAAKARYLITTGDASAIILAPQDSDADGLPDWWERRFFDSLTAALPELDSDGDGPSNLAEFLAGSHPLDAGFQRQQLAAPWLRGLAADSRSAQLQILGSEGATYRLEQSPDLRAWTTIQTGLSSGQIILVTPQPPTVPTLFFRAVLQEP